MTTLREDERGQSTVELALCLPVLAVLMCGLVEVGALVGDKARLEHAAREAARVAIVSDDESAALSAALDSGLDDLEIEIDPRPELRVQGERLTVRLTHRPSGKVPILGALLSRVRLEADAVMRIERP